MRFSRIAFVGIFSLLFSSCDKTGTAGSSGPTYACDTSSKSYSGCCSSHGGAQSCSPPVGGFYFRNDGVLMCNDNSASPSCTK